MFGRCRHPWFTFLVSLKVVACAECWGGEEGRGAELQEIQCVTCSPHSIHTEINSKPPYGSLFFASIGFYKYLLLGQF